jgi:methyltransferase (TIGR00027 family)
MLKLLIGIVHCVTANDMPGNDVTGRDVTGTDVTGTGVTDAERPSLTALTAAAARAAHLIVDGDPPIFADVLASAILGDQADEFISYHRAHGAHLVLSSARAQVTCRSRYAEDRLADCVRRGVSQYVILGAGLDSFAYRCGLAGQVRVFEVDHPATLRWKRRLLSAARIAVPPGLAFVPVDFESGSLAERLAQGGFDPSRPALVSWLGVTMYLTRAAISQTLAAIGRFAPGTEVIIDYMLPAGMRDAAGDSYAEQVMPVAAQRGEPWLTFLSPGDMSGLLGERGFGSIRHVHQRDTVTAATWDRSDSLRPIELSRLACATVSGKFRDRG